MGTPLVGAAPSLDTHAVPKGYVDGLVLNAYDEPTDLGFLTWSHDPRYAISNSAPTAGTLCAQRQRLRKALAVSDTIGHQLYVQTAGAGSTALANCFVGLYRADTLALIAGSATQATAWASTGVKEVTLTCTAAKPAGVDVWSVILVGTQATTPVQFGRLSGFQSAALSNGKGPMLWGVTASGNSSLPATLPSLTASGLNYYAALF